MGKAPQWEGDVGSCKNQCHRFQNSPTYQDEKEEAPSSDDGSSDDASELPEVDEEDPNAECKSACAAKVGPCKKQCVNDYPKTLDDWNAMCEEGMGVFGSMPSVEVCKERGEGEYSCGENGPCTQSPQGNCKGRCEDEVPRSMEECDCEGDDCPNPGKAYKAPQWEGDVGSCKNQCHRFANSPTYQDDSPSSDDGWVRHALGGDPSDTSHLARPNVRGLPLARDPFLPFVFGCCFCFFYSSASSSDSSPALSIEKYLSSYEFF